MGLFGFGKKKAAKPMAPAKKARPSRAELQQRAKDKLAGLRAEAELRELREQERFMRDLRERDPQRYAKLMEQKLGIGSQEEEESIDPLDVAERTLKRMERFEKTFKRGEGEGESALSVIVNSPLAVSLVQVAGRDAVRAFISHVTGQPLPPDGEGPTITVRNPQAVESAAPSAPVAAVADAQGAEVVPEEPQSAPLFTQWVISRLEHRSPPEAAAWLMSLSEKRDDARQLVQLICRIQDEQIPAALTETEQRSPNLAPLITWLRARPEWLLATVKEVRQVAQPAAAGSIAGSIMGL